MTNYEIADSFSLLARLMDVHGENSFKSKSYSSTAFAIEGLGFELSDYPAEKLEAVKGIGASGAKKIQELLATGKMQNLEDLLLSTPPGILEMMRMKGIGPKKIHTIWKEMEIETIGELLYACTENRLKMYKGFGEKTQQQIKDIIEFNLQNKGSYLYASVTEANEQILHLITQNANCAVVPGGAFLRQEPIINQLTFIADATPGQLSASLGRLQSFQLEQQNNNSLLFNTSAGVKIQVIARGDDSLDVAQIIHSCTPEFLEALPTVVDGLEDQDFFTRRNLQYIPPYLRDQPLVIQQAAKGALQTVVSRDDVHGLIHAHSTWSDGANTLEEMALAAMDKGLSYMLITDHSKSAFYAHGLYEDKLQKQHAEIDALNKKLSPFKIFKGIESDILNDGSLDYEDAVLDSFDLIIGSVHSNLKMTEEKAMARLLSAIKNPYMSVLGHMTGRLLLSRAGYPVDHDAVIEACAMHNVAIELNANPNRLDMDWTYIKKATDRGVMMSINPDAHSLTGIDDITYGVLVAQKAQLTAAQNLSSLTLDEFEKYVATQKAKR